MTECYIYGLYDPNTNELFYIGKGTGYRDTSHLKPSMWKNPKESVNPFLYYKIRSLMDNNTPPVVKRLYENITEQEAYDIENKLIIEHGRRFCDKGGKLFNISEFMGGNKKGGTIHWDETRRKEWQNFCKKNRKYDPTYEELYDEYITQNMRREDIATKHNVSDVLVKKRLQYFGIQKPKELQYPKKNGYSCKHCGTNFETPASVKHRKYCSQRCRHEYERNNKVFL